MACSNCGRESPTSGTYCAYCGSRVSGTAEPLEYRPLEHQAGQPAPRDLGALVGETFDMFRGNWRPFLLIALIPQIPLLIASITPLLLSAVLVFAGILLSALANAATVVAVTQTYSGAEIDVGDCFRRAWNRIISLAVAFVLFGLALVGCAILMLILVGVPLFFYVLVVWFFATQVIMVERLGPIAALSRSATLVRGSWWRVFGIGIVFVLIAIGLSVVGRAITVPLSFASAFLANIAGSVVSMLVISVVWIGSTLVYLDLRVRKGEYSLNATD